MFKYFIISKLAILIVLPLLTQLISSQSQNNNKTLFLCKDGKGPLLEGEESIYQCFDNICPAGFFCENFNQNKICCPNLNELFKLYNEASAEIIRRESSEINKEKFKIEQNQSEPIINAMELLEKHYGNTIARERPLPITIENKSSEFSTSNSPQPINLSKNNFQTIRDSLPVDQIKKQFFEANIWRPKIFSSKKIYIDASGEEFSCKRQRLEPFCENGKKKTQFVMRWFAKEGICYSYPWGYCPGEPIATDRTIRTLKECEALCTDKIDNYQIKEPLPISGIVRLKENEQENENEKIFNKKEETLKFEEINENNNFIITSTSSNNNNNKEDLNNNEKANNEYYKTIINSSNIHHPHQNPIKVPPSSASAELAEFLLSEQRPHLKIKRCEKITPYRTICPLNGLSSQFTLRWYQRGDSCFAYPYGYCNGDSIYEEEPIKTEKECLLFCVQRKGEDIGGWMARRRLMKKLK